MTKPTDKQRVELRLPAAIVAAAKEAAYQERMSLNAWAAEAFAFYLAHLQTGDMVVTFDGQPDFGTVDHIEIWSAATEGEKLYEFDPDV